MVFFSYYSVSVACIFGVLKSLISFDFIECIEIDKNACGDLRLLTSFDLIEYLCVFFFLSFFSFADARGLTMVRCPFCLMRNDHAVNG